MFDVIESLEEELHKDIKNVNLKFAGGTSDYFRFDKVATKEFGKTVKNKKLNYSIR